MFIELSYLRIYTICKCGYFALADGASSKVGKIIFLPMSTYVLLNFAQLKSNL